MRSGRLLPTLLSISTVFATSMFALPSASAVSVLATGTFPAVCDQVVNNSTGVTATRLAGGDCVVKFASAGVSYEWDAPAGLYSVTYLVVGGGGSGGTGWDSVGAAGGGGGMVLTGTEYVTPGSAVSVSVGAGGAQSTNARGSYNGNDGSPSTFNSITALGGKFGYTARGNSGVVQAGGAAQVGVTTPAKGGSGGYSGGAAGGGGGGAGSAGTNGSGNTAGLGGAGVSNSISGTAVTYGAGGNGGYGGSNVTGASGAANTGNGSVGGSAGGAASSSGGVGGSGVVYIRYSPVGPSVNSFVMQGTPAQAVYRVATTIEINVTLASRITFFANDQRIGGCIALATSGSGSTHTVSCPWKPTKKGAMRISALVKPVYPGFSSTSTEISIAVVARATNR